jgi:hypothetical protein
MLGAARWPRQPGRGGGAVRGRPGRIPEIQRALAQQLLQPCHVQQLGVDRTGPWAAAAAQPRQQAPAAAGASVKEGAGWGSLQVQGLKDRGRLGGLGAAADRRLVPAGAGQRMEHSGAVRGLHCRTGWDPAAQPGVGGRSGGGAQAPAGASRRRAAWDMAGAAAPREHRHTPAPSGSPVGRRPLGVCAAWRRAAAWRRRRRRREQQASWVSTAQRSAPTCAPPPGPSSC